MRIIKSAEIVEFVLMRPQPRRWKLLFGRPEGETDMKHKLFDQSAVARGGVINAPVMGIRRDFPD